VQFEQVYERFRGPVWRLARRLTGSEEEALDATQEIFLRVWKGLPGFKGRSKLSTWVFQIAWNYLRLHHRKSLRRPLEAVDNGSAECGGLVDAVPDPAPDAERQATSRQILDCVEQALAELPEHYRVVVWLRDGEGLSYQDIATALGVPVGTVRSRLARARTALKEECDP
jgi:RNA polymerase sigma-70 factor (ECF subfamily)